MLKFVVYVDGEENESFVVYLKSGRFGMFFVDMIYILCKLDLYCGCCYKYGGIIFYG